jgi:hypothetical protein
LPIGVATALKTHRFAIEQNAEQLAPTVRPPDNAGKPADAADRHRAKRRCKMSACGRRG